MSDALDILIIGGGIVGASAARDAAGRGLSVLLCEANDLASGTTSRSSRMIHGGLRYLEHAEFGLVRESLRERATFYRIADDWVDEKRFLIPVSEFGRPRWMIRAGLFFYDVLSGRKETRTEQEGYSYVDGFCKPETLTAQIAGDASRRGAEIRTYCPVEMIEKNGVVHLASGEKIQPKTILMAVGPWTDRLLSNWGLESASPLLSPTRGTHILLRDPIDRPRLLQAEKDNRVFFALPMWGGTLVGTTDIDDDSDPSALRPREDEIEYLKDGLRRYLPEVADSEIRGQWTGLRPLIRSLRKETARSRGEEIVTHPTVENLYICLGGKLTTSRLMAERAIDRIENERFNRPAVHWTANEKIAPAKEGIFAKHLSDYLLRRTELAFAGSDEEIKAAAEKWCTENRMDFAAEWPRFQAEARHNFGLAS